ncbi:MAG: thiamine pyrophosphate-binding protein, partial [Alphaproteobacteria bacterium]|nr:thiamine pyrophosphate-binding protein [Alphaproteobacteria bacterium]
MKYSDLMADWLVEAGYTTCFFLAGGNIMHILESCSRKMKMIPVVHEVAAGIAVEYFNETKKGERAFALVTAGPGLTNIITAMSGAYLESRELLVIGGQVKTADLARGTLRQNGIQEIDGVAIAKPISVLSVLMDDVLPQDKFIAMAKAGSSGRKGPVFIELPLDVQARNVDEATLNKKTAVKTTSFAPIAKQDLEKIAQSIRDAKRPVLLIGGGISRETAASIAFEKLGVAVTTTWNGADRITADKPNYFGRPNTWGMRYSNLVMQQADVLVALGTRLGMQQTGFNWQEFAPLAKVIQVECDKAELEKGHPVVHMPICGDANDVLNYLGSADLGQHHEWLDYCRMIKKEIPMVEEGNTTGEGFISPYHFVQKISALCEANDVIIPCSSGSAFTSMMQVFELKQGQLMVTNKGLASMGYGLSGAIGAAIAANGQRTILVEGDGGFSQNIQEIGTAAANKLNLKIFIYDDNGYASIRMTQSNYFGGRYVGCDGATGLGLPHWAKLFSAWDVPTMNLKPGFENDAAFKKAFADKGPAAFIVPVDPKQTYFPKITSKVTETGGMVSNPLHRMSPDLDAALYAKVAKYL